MYKLVGQKHLNFIVSVTNSEYINWNMPGQTENVKCPTTFARGASSTPR